MKRKLLVAALLAFIAIDSSAQIGFKLIQFRPVGELGMVMSKKITGELMYLQEFDEKTRMRFGLSFTSLKPRLDTFPVYAYKDDGQLSVLPGYEVYHKYNMIILFGGMDYAFIDEENLFVYAGLDILIGGVDQQYDRAYETYVDESFSGGSKLAGGRLRIGGEYMFNENIGAFLELSRAMYYVEDSQWLSNNDIGIGVHYVFER